MQTKIGLSPELIDSIKEVLKVKGKVTIYWDRNDSVSEDSIIRALEEENPLHAISNELDELNEGYYDAQISHLEYILESFLPQIKAELQDDFTSLNDLATDLRDELLDYLSIDDDLKSILPELDIRIELFSDNDCINSHWYEEQGGGYSYQDNYFGDVIDELRLNPHAVKQMLIQKGIQVMGNWPRRSDKKRLIEYAAFWQEIENRSCGANQLVVVGKVKAIDLLNNFCYNKPLTILIPKGNYVGFFSSSDGGGSTIEAPLLTDHSIIINAKLPKEGRTYRLFIDHGSYSINGAYGVTNSFWGKKLKIETNEDSNPN